MSGASKRLFLMKQFANVFLIAIVIAVFGSLAVAQKPVADANAKDSRFFPLGDLRPGMKGISQTVFSGTEPQEFGVEVLGVLPGYPSPRQSLIIARLSGANV